MRKNTPDSILLEQDLQVGQQYDFDCQYFSIIESLLRATHFYIVVAAILLWPSIRSQHGALLRIAALVSMNAKPSISYGHFSFCFGKQWFPPVCAHYSCDPAGACWAPPPLKGFALHADPKIDAITLYIYLYRYIYIYIY